MSALSDDVEDEEINEEEHQEEESEEESDHEDEQMSLDETDERSEVQRFMAHVPNIPSQADIEAALVERKKRELLQTFLGD